MDSLFPEALNIKTCPNCGKTKSPKRFPSLNEWCRQCLKEARETAPPGKGFCVICKAYLLIAEFGPGHRGARLTSACRKCHSKRAFVLHRQKYDVTESRDKNLQKNHGITLAEYTAMLEAQGGVCAVCKLPETHMHPKGRPLPLAVDHDHETDEIRGLLCNRCNRALGFLRDDPELVQAMLEYIRRRVLYEQA